MLENIIETFDKNYQRLENLIATYERLSGTTSGRRNALQLDLLRSTVVFAHSSLENFIRDLQYWKLPESDKEVLNEVSLIGVEHRRKKFSLGELQDFKELKVAQVIENSIREHLDQQSYNNVNDLVNALRTCGLQENKELTELYPKLDTLIQRRHHIVHQADINIQSGRGHHRFRSISLQRVRNWINTIDEFALQIIKQLSYE